MARFAGQISLLVLVSVTCAASVLAQGGSKIANLPASVATRERASVGLQYRVFGMGPGADSSLAAVDSGANPAVLSVPQLQTELAQSAVIQPERLAQGLIAPGTPHSYLTPALRELLGARPPKRGFGGFLGKLFEPFLSPVTEGLADTADSLRGTAGAVTGLQDPLYTLAEPLNRLAGPLSGLSSPLNELGTPLTALQQPLSDLREPLLELHQPIGSLGKPVLDLSRSAGSLSEPMRGLSVEMVNLRRPLSGMAEPLAALPVPLRGLVRPLTNLQSSLGALHTPLGGVASSLTGLQGEMHALRMQIETLHQALLDIGRNVTLAIVFGCSVIAYAIWNQRRIPEVAEHE